MNQENSNKKEFAFSDLTDKEWLNPLAVLDLQDAVHKQQSSVVLNGRTFNIQYHDIQIDDHGIMTGRVFVKVVGNYAPCGWFGIQTLLNYEFEADHDKHL